MKDNHRNKPANKPERAVTEKKAPVQQPAPVVQTSDFLSRLKQWTKWATASTS